MARPRKCFNSTLMRSVFVVAGLTMMQSVSSAPTQVLRNNQWSMLSLPVNSNTGNTVSQVFADELPIADYGASGNWVLFGYDTTDNRYSLLPLNQALTAGTGYWIIQKTGADVQLDLPANATVFASSTSPACPSANGCIEVPIETSGSNSTWNLLGYPLPQAQSFSKTRIRTDSGVCVNGCTPDEAQANNILHNVLFKYNGSHYHGISPTDTLQPWDAFWVLALPEAAAQATTWLVPLPEKEPDANRDAARLLAQATFGTTMADINSVIAAGGAESWIEDQLSLAPSYHLPLVHELAEDGWGTQPDRYQAFWQRALYADDQLRQRMAFALSEIMVVSDIPDALINHGNMLAHYYDLLLQHAFGNYRGLLEAVTLAPAMGIYLSMMGNDKPDLGNGRRADENYAREIMQLFSIGLHELNLNGTVKRDRSGNPISAYSQTDVKNLANTFTGWSWDKDNWQVDTVAGWWPDRSLMEKPMRAFPEHHDTGVKEVLGTTLPAGQSPAQDLNAALDILYNHPNVGPFISRQLIQRLVTSNPSPDYIARVATVFNNNDQGTRGDLGAVVKAILMDEEARSPTLASADKNGKLREPLLRLSHLWRAFGMTNPVPMGFWRDELSQHAPLTASSVFNFFSPDHSPPGNLGDAALVAPEFQINSETFINKVNGALMWVIQQGSFFDVFPTPLDLSVERTLAASPGLLVDHLDLLLLSGSMSEELRQLLVDYIDDNTSFVGTERTLRDVIALTITSAEYAIQR